MLALSLTRPPSSQHCQAWTQTAAVAAELQPAVETYCVAAVVPAAEADHAVAGQQSAAPGVQALVWMDENGHAQSESWLYMQAVADLPPLVLYVCAAQVETQPAVVEASSGHPAAELQVHLP